MFGRDRLRAYEGETVLVHQRSGPTIRGVLVAAHTDCFVLAHAMHLDEQVELAGEPVIPKVAGVWLQTRLPEATS